MKFQSDKYLYPSELYVTDKPETITTVLGSCVAVCLWDPIAQVGGINHFMLPNWNGKGLASPKYGNIATIKLIEKMLIKGAKKERIVSKVFGGAAVINQERSNFNIGERNIEIARKVLIENNISVKGHNVGGFSGRKIVFETKTGSVYLKFLVPEHAFQKTVL